MEEEYLFDTGRIYETVKFVKGTLFEEDFLQYCSESA